MTEECRGCAVIVALRVEMSTRVLNSKDFIIRGVTRRWAGVLVTPLGLYKKRVLGWAKK